MSENYYYSAKNNAFYSLSMKANYIAANSWPDDATLISFSWYQRLMEGQSKGLQIMADEYGQPVLKKTVKTKEDFISEAEATRSSLMQKAGQEIAPLQDAADLKIATANEMTTLAAWKKYRVLLNRVDTSTAPDIAWPEKPGNVA